MTSLIASNTPDQQAAHYLLSELRTRIAVQQLPYQYGIEARALESLWEIFGLSREAMKTYPGCQEFSQLTTDMLNVDLRPVTAKWHRAHKAGLLDSKDGANDFRVDLASLQVKLVSFCESLQIMAYGTKQTDRKTPSVIDDEDIKGCFAPVTFGINKFGSGSIANADDINSTEEAEINARRNHYGIDKPVGEDAVGMSLSGGGIRSATFCLGVVQVIAERGLMKEFDYLSTVSGGGYIGSFITSIIGGGKDYSDIGKPYGPDTEQIRYVRQNAKYLSAADFKKRWSMVTGTMAGLVLNWSAPVSILAILALLGNLLATHFSESIWLSIAAVLASITVSLTAIYGFTLRFNVGARLASQILAWAAGCTLFTLAGFVSEKGYDLFSVALSSHWEISGYMAVWVIVTPAIARFLPMFRAATTKTLILNGAILASGAIVPLLALATYYLLRIVGSMPPESAPVLAWAPEWFVGTNVLISLAVFSGVVAMFLDVNSTGLHKLYRDQLSNTFVQESEEVRQLPLSSVNMAHKAPYHIINATINLPSSRNRTLRDRRGDFFIFSKHWAGSAATGYERSTSWTSNGKEIDLSTAMAISGAAASPQMGKSSIPTLSALLTLLNVRLGYWIKNPKTVQRGSPGFRCLLREMTGFGMSEEKPWLNLSDGGHIENMGIYELLRRRCKFIVCVDGEADPRSTFEGQLTLVRHAQIDFGVRLEPRLDDIRLDPKSNFSRTHSHLLRIHYPATSPDHQPDIGLMLYLKLSLTGDETELLKRYRLVSPEFPHEATTDQFYSEEQFEAYRQLGVHVAEGVFSSALLTENPNPTNIDSWFMQLAKNMLEPTR
ncbi:hypothetical protein [Pseudomonas sp. D1HM]|uniref:hypothetical protein n=1 Tax=Pseudomonas sp. D1HM TaxID=1784816 RepID=UPI001C4FC6BE|nr:hypothetical protein [Pseudomonas sp. D1HM]MBW0238370.1 hypothetical protein [Pseudomonas sp. D1HM]